MKAIGGIIALAAICAVGIWGYLTISTRQAVFIVALHGLKSDHETVVFGNGREVARIRGEEHPEITVAGGESWRFDSGLIPMITARHLRPCGWEEIPLGLEGYVFEESLARRNFDLGRPILLPRVAQFGAEDDRYIHLWIDNRKGTGATLAVGQFTRPIVAGFAGMVELPVDPSCREGLELKFNGEKVAELPEDIPTSRELGDLSAANKQSPSLAYLLDPTGAACYSQRLSYYTESFFDRESGSIPKPVKLERNFVHRLPREVDDLFRESPTTVRLGPGQNARLSIVDMPCTGELSKAPSRPHGKEAERNLELVISRTTIQPHYLVAVGLDERAATEVGR
jgi:hypothetical protein